MHTQTAAQKAPRAIEPLSEQKKPSSLIDGETTRTEDREILNDDDLYANLAHTD